MEINTNNVKSSLLEYNRKEILYRKYHQLTLQNPDEAKQYVKSLPESDRDYFQYEDPDVPVRYSRIMNDGSFLILSNIVLYKNDITVTKHDRYAPAFLHRHDFYEILYVYEGSCTNTIQNKVLHLVKGDLCTIPPDAVHYISVLDDSIVLNILVKETTFNRIINSLFPERSPFTQMLFHVLCQKDYNNYLLFHTGNNTVLCSTIEKLYIETMNSFKYAGPMLQSYFSELWTLLMRHHESDLELNIQKKDQNISLADMLIYFQKNYASLTLEEAARHFGFSSPHFSKLVKRFTGQNFVQILHYLKLQNASTVLLETELSMQEICEHIGFDSQSHFSRAFKAEYGLSPTQFRKKNK